MNDLGLDLAQVLTWFPHEMDAPYVLVRVSAEHAEAWSAVLGVAVRRCYITDSVLKENSASRHVSQSEIIGARLPDPGATMAGDFGEILVYLYQGAREQPNVAYGATKWRLKQDRTKQRLIPTSFTLYSLHGRRPANTIAFCALRSRQSRQMVRRHQSGVQSKTAQKTALVA